MSEQASTQWHPDTGGTTGTVPSSTQDAVSQRLRRTVSRGHIHVTALWGTHEMTFSSSVFLETRKLGTKICRGYLQRGPGQESLLCTGRWSCTWLTRAPAALHQASEWDELFLSLPHPLGNKTNDTQRGTGKESTHPPPAGQCGGYNSWGTIQDAGSREKPFLELGEGRRRRAHQVLIETQSLIHEGGHTEPPRRKNLTLMQTRSGAQPGSSPYCPISLRPANRLPQPQCPYL